AVCRYCCLFAMREPSFLYGPTCCFFRILSLSDPRDLDSFPTRRSSDLLADFTDAKCIEEASKGGFFRFFQRVNHVLCRFWPHTQHGRAHVWTPVAYRFRMPSSAWKKREMFRNSGINVWILRGWLR